MRSRQQNSSNSSTGVGRTAVTGRRPGILMNPGGVVAGDSFGVGLLVVDEIGRASTTSKMTYLW